MNNLIELREVQLSYKVKSDINNQPELRSSDQAYQLLIRECYDPETIEYRESIKLIFLNTKKRVLGIMNLTDGGIASAIADIRVIMQAAILSCSCGIIISHNHPSKNVKPSREDDSLTYKLKKACEVMEIELCDHIIVTTDNYYSYSDEGKL